MSQTGKNTPEKNYGLLMSYLLSKTFRIVAALALVFTVFLVLILGVFGNIVGQRFQVSGGLLISLDILAGIIALAINLLTFTFFAFVFNVFRFIFWSK